MYLIAAPLLSPSVMGEELFLYLTVTPHAVSSALIREEGKVQKPVYYTSRAVKNGSSMWMAHPRNKQEEYEWFCNPPKEIS